MYIQAKNENFGYSVATFGKFVATGNPSLIRYNPLTSSIYWSGSIHLYRYNYSVDQHDYITTLYKDSILQETLLATETPDSMKTEPNGTDDDTKDKDIQIDKNLYTRMLEDGYGVSVDIFDNTLTVGCPYFMQTVETDAGFLSAATGSGVDIFNLGVYENDAYNTPISTTSSAYIITLKNPDDWPSTGSFGHAVSINSGWIAVGSPYVSGSEGMVYIYKNDSTESELSWSFQQKIQPPDTTAGLMFGAKLELNKNTGSNSGSLIIGVGNNSGSRAFLFEYISGSWTQTFVFNPSFPRLPLTFGGYTPYSETYPTANRYGTAVGIYNNTVVVGSSQDRIVKEFTSSYEYEQGAVYVYELCPNVSPTQYELVLKTYGDETILKNNRLGYSVSTYNDKIIAGSPKIDVDDMSSCYIQATLEQLHYCDSDLEKILTGQAMFLLKNTSSSDWEISKIYQKKKKYLSPYRAFGYAVDIADWSMVIGAPLLFSDSNRYINVSVSRSFDVDVGDITGKSYIYNLHNYHEQFHVGNAFYRNGKILLMTSGSVFEGLLFNPISEYNYEYQIDFKGEHTIYEKQIICSVEPGEFNVSTNPSAITKATSTWDINRNGTFDFQDIDILLQYMQYKNTQLYTTGEISTNWSSSIVTSDDEKSLLAYYNANYDRIHTDVLLSESIQRFEFVDTWMQSELDLNRDNRIDTNDLYIMWKYFANRLTQENYNLYISPACNRKSFSDIVDYMATKTNKKSIPYINSSFFDYERLTTSDKTGSYLAPYVTTIGLYSGLDLVAVAKLGSPVKITPELPINFAIKIDF